MKSIIYLSTLLGIFSIFCRAERDVLSELLSCKRINLGNCSELEYEIAFAKYQATEKLVKPISLSGPIADAGNLKYSVLFQDFVLAQRPFKGQVDGESDIGLCRTDINIATLNNLTDDISLSGCSMSSSSIIIPAVANNNYFFRIQSPMLEATKNTEHNFVDYSTHWPALLTLKAGIPTKVSQCPMSLHQLVVNPLANPVRIRLFSVSAKQEFEPLYNDHNWTGIPRHITKFNKTGFPMIAQPDQKRFVLPKYVEAHLAKDEYLFIPNSMLASFVMDGNNDGELVRFCFVDASNINAVRDSFAVSSLVSTFDRHIFELLHGGVSMSMIKAPQDLPLSSIKGEDSGLARAPRTDEIETGITSTRLAPRKRGAETTGGNRDWLEAKQWDSLVQSLTLCPPFDLSTSNIGRTNFTANWFTSFFHDQNNVIRFGFNISICSLKLLPDASHCRVVELDYNPATTHFSLATKVESSADSGQDIYAYSVIVPGLEPDGLYQFQVQMYHGQAVTSYSSWSPVFQSLPLTAPSAIPDANSIRHGSDDLGPGKKKRKKPAALRYRTEVVEARTISCIKVELSFRRPLDDGGSPIIDYLVEGRYVYPTENNFPSNWQRYSVIAASADTFGFETLQIEGLVGDIDFEFRVAAVNSVGVGPFSSTSNSVKTLPYPRGQQVSLYRISNMSSPVVVRLSNFDERVSLASNITFNEPARDLMFIRSWRCHWSPVVDVVGNLAVANPVMASSEIINIDEIKGNIAVVLRGGAPVVFKIRRLQLAGASGVIIVDDGACIAFDQSCFPGSDQMFNEGFAAHDEPNLWLDTRIPVAFVLRKDTEIFLKYLNQFTKMDLQTSGDEFSIIHEEL